MRRRETRATVRDWVEFLPLWAAVRLLGWVPRPLALRLGTAIGRSAARIMKRLRSTGLENLERAFPELSSGERAELLDRAYSNLGRQLAEFCQMPAYSLEQASRFITYYGLEHYLAAKEKGKGVLVVTGHLGFWELSSYFHSLAGHPMGLLIRSLDNPLVDRMVNRVRCLHGNRVIDKDDFARGLISAMRAGETVGILMDTNMTPPQGIFVPFFGVDACTGAGLARIAHKTGAAVLPGFLLRESSSDRYTLWFGEEIALAQTGDLEADVRADTAEFTRIIEHSIRRAPDQWLWMHRRWKTRPFAELKSNR